VQPGVRGAQGAAQRDGQERRRQAKTPPTLGDSEDPGQGGLYRGTHCVKVPFMYFFSGNCAASFSISTFVCL
jgi:hypothetical protein